MSAKTTKRIFAVLVTVFLAPAFAGCFGEEKKPASAENGGGVALPGTDPKPGDDAPIITDHTNSADPKAHFHHLWNERPFVHLWNGAPVNFTTMDTRYMGDYNSLTWAEFGFEDDGSQVNDAEATEAAPGNHADVVFAGTSHIEMKFPDTFFDGTQRLKVFWKPANTNVFGGGTIVNVGETINIPLTQTGMSDPPHQNAVSRWKFRLVAFDSNQVCDQGIPQLCPPSFSTGTSTEDPASRTVQMQGLEMIAHNGGTESLDPPHPDFWGPNSMIKFQTIERTVSDPIVQTPVFRERSPALIDIAPMPGDMVPMGTERVEITVGWTADQAPPEGFLLKLRYHGADSVDYQVADPKEGVEATGAKASNTYVVYNYVGGKDQGLVDPPYDSRSFWRFELVPTIKAQDGTESLNTGVFTGTYTIDVEVFKRSDFVLS